MKKQNSSLENFNSQDKNSIKLVPVNILIIPTDNITRQIFNTENKKEEFEVEEGDGLKSKVKFANGANDLNQLDRLVYYAALSEQAAGNNITSTRRLWQKIGGSHFLTPNMRQLISDSVEKLASKRVEINMTDVNEKRRYSGKKELIYRRNILPNESATAKINGQIVTDAILFLKNSPVMDSAQAKKQFTTCDISLLDVPNLRNTEQTLKIKGYLLCRTVESIGSNRADKKHFAGRGKDGKPYYRKNKKLSDKILIEKIIKESGLEETLKWQRQDLHKSISKIMNHFKEKGLIQDWNFEKENGKNRAVKFTF